MKIAILAVRAFSFCVSILVAWGALNCLADESRITEHISAEFAIYISIVMFLFSLYKPDDL